MKQAQVNGRMARSRSPTPPEPDDTASIRLLYEGDATVAREVALWKFALIAEMRDLDTLSHMMRVGQISGLLALRLTGSREYSDLVCRAAPLHDVGKVCIADSVLKKPGALDANEWHQMRQHPAIGARLLHWPGNDLFTMAEAIALRHHERYDGAGYPDGMAGEAIPLCARIVTVADYFDALTMDRCYRPAVPVPQVLTAISGLIGNHFDPQAAGLLLRIHEDVLELVAAVNAKFAERPTSELDHRAFRPIY